MPVEHVVARFGQYWSEFVEREAEDDGTQPPAGVYAELQAGGYPQLAEMLESYEALFSALVSKALQTEFTGYVINSPREVQVQEPAYFMQSLTALSVIGSSVVLEGRCCEFRKHEP